MFIISGVNHQLISNLPDSYSMNHSLSIGSINNTFDRAVWQEGVGSNLKRTSVSVYRAHDVAYSAYAHRKKRAAGRLQYSADVCREASSELAGLVSAVAAHPGTWGRLNNRIRELQNITKSADCRVGR